MIRNFKNIYITAAQNERKEKEQKNKQHKGKRMERNKEGRKEEY